MQQTHSDPRRSFVRRAALAAAVTLALVLVADCAAFNRRNTRLVNAVEKHALPDATGARIITAPVWLPLGVLGGILDVFIVHPAYVLPSAVKDTADWLWSPRPNIGYVTLMGSVPFRLLFTPIVFTADFLARAGFDIGSDPEKPQVAGRPVTPEELLKKGTEKDARRWLERNATLAGPDRSAAVRVFLGRARHSHSRFTALRYLAFGDRFSANEPFLLAQLSLALQGRGLFRGGSRSHLVSIFQERRSARASALFMAAIRKGGLSTEDFRFYFNSVLNIGHAPHIAELQNRLQSGRSE